MKKIGIIDYYLNEWHADHINEWLTAASDGEYQIAYAWGEIDCPREGSLSNVQWADKHGVTLCETQEELVEKSDFLCVLAPDNTETHERLSRLALLSGKPTYIDKVFAPNVETAKRIFDLAVQNNTPCFSSSALRYADEYKDIDVKDVSEIVSKGGGAPEIYLIHQVEPIVMMTGLCAKQVRMVDDTENTAFILKFESGQEAHINFLPGDAPFEMSFHRNNGSVHSIVVESDVFVNFAKDLVRFFATGETTVSHRQTISVVAILEACLAAMSTGEWIDVDAGAWV